MLGRIGCLNYSIIRNSSVSLRPTAYSQLGQFIVHKDHYSGTTRKYSTSSSAYYKTASSNTRKNKLWLKIKSAIRFGASSLLVVGAAGVTGVVVYLVVSELLLPSSDTQIFNRAVNIVENDKIARNLLQCNDGNGLERLKAHGGYANSDRWARNRPITSLKQLDRDGKKHYFMKFRVESLKKSGLVSLEAIQSDKFYKVDFVRMSLDVIGEKRYHLIKPKIQKSKPNGILGLFWGPTKN